MESNEAEQQRLLQALLRQDFSSFITKVFYTINPGATYYHNWHIDLIADYLEEVRKGNIKRLIINIPPRNLKSICVSVAWPAFLLGADPTTRIMVASYSSILSIKHSLDCRMIMQSKWYSKLFPQTILSKKHNRKNKYLTSLNGFRFATSVGGSTTGEGADMLIIDDPHNPTQIHSQKLRNKAIYWYEQTFVSRLNNPSKGAIIFVIQRLHLDDLAGYLLNNGNWELLKIPLIAEKDITYKIQNKQYHYYQDQLLSKQRFSPDNLHKLKSELGKQNFAAQYMQEPVTNNYNLLSLNDITYYDILPQKFSYFILSWDTAIKISEESDYSVGLVFGIYEERYYLIDMIRRKMNYPMLKKAIEKQIQKFKPRYILIEDKASGQSIIQDLLLGGHNNIKKIMPKLDKLTRFAATISLFQSGKILLPKKAKFSRILLDEITTFPNSHHDDIVDAMSQFLNFMKSKNNTSILRIRQL